MTIQEFKALILILFGGLLIYSAILLKIILWSVTK